MSSKRLKLGDVSDAARDFKVIVAVDTVLPVRKTMDGRTDLQRLLFRDDQGTEMGATIFDEDVGLFDGCFVEGKTYELTNPIITKLPSGVANDGIDYQMTIKSKTRVVENKTSLPTPSPSPLVPISSANEHVGQNRRMDIMGVVVLVHRLRTVFSRDKGREFDIRELTVVDRDLHPTKVTLWHSLATNDAEEIYKIIDSFPVVLITRVVATTFRGGGWTTSTFTAIKLQSEHPEAAALSSWRNDNGEAISNVRAQILLAGGDLAQASNQEEMHTISVTSLKDQEEGRTVCIKGVISDISNSEHFIYNSCNVCKTKTTQPLGKKFTCSSRINNKQTEHEGTSTARCILHVTFCDGSGTVNITLFDHLAEKLLGKTASELSQLTQEEQHAFACNVLDHKSGQEFAIKMATYKINAYNKQLRWKPLYLEESRA